ncbi:hypothetical protein K501DRAFT_269526 [Backusella circina FSU 941]|nr:hypothetical protein K501DRAFT_269526 [Backusella circina FSU 941]
MHEIKTELQEYKRKLFNCRNPNAEKVEEPKRCIINDDTRGYLGKSENTELPWKMVKKKSYSGTNNGLVTMTETVGFTAERFENHIDLYNRYAVLKDDLDEDSQRAMISPPFLERPKAHNSKAKDVVYT